MLSARPQLQLLQVEFGGRLTLAQSISRTSLPVQRRRRTNEGVKKNGKPMVCNV